MIEQGVSYKLALLVSFTILFVGLGILIWLSAAFTGVLTESQDTLKNIADWMVKSTVGGIFGLIGGKGFTSDK